MVSENGDTIEDRSLIQRNEFSNERLNFELRNRLEDSQKETELQIDHKELQLHRKQQISEGYQQLQSQLKHLLLQLQQKEEELEEKNEKLEEVLKSCSLFTSSHFMQ